ncbi:MFS transporter [Nocardioides sp. GY 10127]|nr:MFS transporter [Nocardioides sp. GY 10127]TIC80050.1 MFS transporter [Nocardioides sp. GY 10127]
MQKTESSERLSGRGPSDGTGRAPDSEARDSGARGSEVSGGLAFLRLLVIGGVELVVIADSSIINVALPKAAADLALTTTQRGWVVTAYTLAFGDLLLVGGRVGDRLGRRRTLMLGVLAFAVASAVGGLATDGATLLAARALQGAAAALIAPSALALLTLSFPGARQRGRALGVWSAIGGTGFALGLVVGGILAQYVGWRSCMLVSVPFSLAAVVGVWLWLPHDPPQRDRRLDLLGSALAMVTIWALNLGLSEVSESGTFNARAVALLVVTVLVGALFVRAQRWTPDPVLPFRLLRDRLRRAGLLAAMLASATVFVYYVYMAFYLQDVLGQTPLQSGLAFLPLSGALAVAAPMAGRLVSAVSPRLVLAIGMACTASGTALSCVIAPDSRYLLAVLPGSIVLGVGCGFTNVAVNTLVLRGADRRDAGTLSAFGTAANEVGGSIGLSVAAVLVTWSGAAWLTGHPGASAAELQVHTDVVLFAAFVASLVLGILVVAWLGRGGDPAAAGSGAGLGEGAGRPGQELDLRVAETPVLGEAVVGADAVHAEADEAGEVGQGDRVG